MPLTKKYDKRVFDHALARRVASKIRDCRKREGISANAFAALLKISRNSLFRYETAKAHLPVDVLIEIADRYQFSLDALRSPKDPLLQKKLSQLAHWRERAEKAEKTLTELTRLFEEFKNNASRDKDSLLR